MNTTEALTLKKLNRREQTDMITLCHIFTMELLLRHRFLICLRPTEGLFGAETLIFPGRQDRRTDSSLDPLPGHKMDGLSLTCYHSRGRRVNGPRLKGVHGPGSPTVNVGMELMSQKLGSKGIKYWRRMLCRQRQ